MTTRRIRNIQKVKQVSRQRHDILSRTPGVDTGPKEKYTYIIAQFRQWLQQADGAHSLAHLFIEEYEKEQKELRGIDIESKVLSDPEKKEVEEYAHNHVREVMEKAFAD
jgi:hypothetical protein